MRDAWWIAASEMALHANIHRNPKKTKAFSREDFDPFASRGSGGNRIPITRENIEMLKIFVRQKP